MSAEAVITVENLSKCYQIYKKPQDRLIQTLLRGRRKNFQEFWALRDVSFQVKAGETFGIIGRNGSGKSTLLQILAGILNPTSGTVDVQGRIAALLELGSGFNPNFTGRENVFLNGQILGLTKQEIEEKYDQIVSFADIGDYINQPVKTYSSGMFVRLAFAVQAHINANIVILDEALAVGDVFFKQKCYARLDELRASGAAILLVSHSMSDIIQFCSDAILLDRGHQKFIGPSSEAAKYYYLLHQNEAEAKISSAQVSSQEQPHKTEDKPSTEQSNPDIKQRPPQSAFLDLSNKSQVADGSARCLGIALCDTEGNPCRSFRQGEKAVFYYEFKLTTAIEVPICGIIIKNDKGFIIHGKNSWQSADEWQAKQDKVTWVSCRHEIEIDLQFGEYTFEVGLASTTHENWKNRHTIPYKEVSNYIRRLCHVPDAGSFMIRLNMQNGIPHLCYHGITNLPGEMAIDSR